MTFHSIYPGFDEWESHHVDALGVAYRHHLRRFVQGNFNPWCVPDFREFCTGTWSRYQERKAVRFDSKFDNWAMKFEKPLSVAYRRYLRAYLA